MSLSAGTHIGPYELAELIGHGGMGEVYRATDTRLKRAVAIKVLPAALSTDPERLARFHREAETLAALNHPNIAQIHGLETKGPITALAMELVEGVTLAERIDRGAIAFEEALRIVTQLAQALEAAHDRGIVHRDLKPANIKIRRDGTLKVLDFGLAKILDAGPATSMAAQAPTLTLPAVTEAGVILGTAAYMSPEQARGTTVDRRTDIWAFGCVFYEMLTGRRPFAGQTVSDTIAAVLEREPNWDALPAAAAAVKGILRRCLEKEVERRLRDIADVRQWLEETAAQGARSQTIAITASRPAGWAAVGLALGLAIGATGVWLRARDSQPSPRPVRRFVITSPQSSAFAPETYGANVAISPDGSRIVYTVTHDGAPALAVRRLDSLEETALTGTEGATYPFFSPDSKYIGFATLDAIKRVPAEGGAVVTITPANAAFIGATWSADDTIVFAEDSGTGLMQVPASGGIAEKVAAPDTIHGEQNYRMPVFVPHSDVLLYTVVLNDRHTRIAARRLGRSEATIVAEGGVGAQYMPPGYVVFAQDGRLMAIKFDTTTLQPTGSPVLLQDNAFTKVISSVANISIAADGTAAYVAGRNGGPLRRLVWVNRKGEHVARAADDALEFARNPRISPDGRRVALTVGASGHADIWVHDLDRAAQPLRLTVQNHNTFPIWSSDGRQITFLSVVDGHASMSSIPADGSVLEPKRVAESLEGDLPLASSPDGGYFLFRRNNNLWLLDLRTGNARLWVETPFSEQAASFSPNGKWVVYSSNQTGRMEIWVRPFPGPGAPVRVSSEGGHDPVWARDGKEIFFENSGKLMAARVTGEAPVLRFAMPERLFDGGFAHDDTDSAIRFFDAAPDGRLLMIEEAGPSSPASIVLLQNWNQELTRLLPPK